MPFSATGRATQACRFLLQQRRCLDSCRSLQTQRHASDWWPNPVQVNIKADMYSFGVLLWEIITLERPLQRGNLREPM